MSKGTGVLLDLSIEILLKEIARIYLSNQSSHVTIKEITITQDCILIKYVVEGTLTFTTRIQIISVPAGSNSFRSDNIISDSIIAVDWR
jgi:hypothetical protein